MKVYCENCKWFEEDEFKWYDGLCIERSTLFYCHNVQVSEKEKDDWKGKYTKFLKPQEINKNNDCKAFEKMICD